MKWRGGGSRRRRDPQRDATSQVGEQLLNHLYYREETFFVVEGSSLRSAKATREAMACERLGDCLRLTILVRVRRPFTCGENAINATSSLPRRGTPSTASSRDIGSRVGGAYSRNLKRVRRLASATGCARNAKSTPVIGTSGSGPLLAICIRKHWLVWCSASIELSRRVYRAPDQLTG